MAGGTRFSPCRAVQPSEVRNGYRKPIGNACCPTKGRGGTAAFTHTFTSGTDVPSNSAGATSGTARPAFCVIGRAQAADIQAVGNVSGKVHLTCYGPSERRGQPI